jgi:hypothetical protein
VHFYQSIPVMATFHPAALLRNPHWKRPTWDDVRKLRALADAFGAIAAANWAKAAARLTEAMADHARIGGSRAQRDLIEFAMAHVLLKLGRGEEARRLLAMRRPVSSASGPVRGLESGAVKGD